MSNKNRTATRLRPPDSKLDIAYLLNENDDGPSTRRPYCPPAGASSSTSRYTVSCSICHAKFDHRNRLVTHMKEAHKKHQCVECLTVFGEKGNLNRHVKSVHRGEKPYKCTQCTMAFPFRDTLQRHISAVHEHHRPFPCTVCGMKFKKRDHLIRHQSSQHNIHPPNRRP